VVANPWVTPRQLNRLLRMLLMTVAATMFAVGVVLVLIRGHFKTSSRDVVVEVGVNLALFGFTTLLVTVIASHQLERRMLGALTDELNAHVDRVKSTMGAVEVSFKDSMDTLVPLLGNCRQLGLENVYLTRTDALIDIESHLHEELKNAKGQDAGEEAKAADGERPPRLWFVGTSLKGVLEASAHGFDGAGILAWASDLAAQGQLDLRVLLTHPEFARIRARQEHRAGSAIPEEISEALEFLHSHEVKAKCIRMTQASPTVFAIATREKMLLNPYPYGAEAHRSFSLIVKREHPALNDHHSLHRDIFEQYEQRHFETPWKDGIQVLDEGGRFGIPPTTLDPRGGDEDGEVPGR
uniref:hypothetical protein n=1 Tax=Catenulispora rubra TaxID=280293 RepID=UPI001E3D4630